MGMGCQVATGILKEDASELTEKAKQKFIDEVKDIVINGSENLRIPSPFPCGDPIPPNPNIDPRTFNLESEQIYAEFHKNVLKGQYEKIAKSLNVQSTFSLLPALADPIALAGSFGVEMPEISFPSGFVPYFSGLLVPKFAVDLLSAGVTDFFPPFKLASKLSELVELPKIPSIPLPPNVTFPPPVPGIPSPTLTVPTPGSLGLPSIPELPGFELPPTPGIPIPVEALSDYVELQIAIAKGIPNLLVEMIGKVPSFLSKIGDPKSILAEICGMVRDSGIFGNIRPTSTVQAAATVVLARKTAECTLNAAFASTIGIAPGSAGCAINQQISGYDTIKKKPPTKGPETPADRVVRYARGLAGTSAGLNDGEPYVSSVYFVESALSRLEKGKVNIMGEPVDLDDPLTKTYSDPKKLIGGTWDQNKTKYAPIEDPMGHYTYAKRYSLVHSSCALFARSCYYAGGFNSGFFLSLYPPATAQSAMRFAFMMRNFKWLKENGTFDEELYKIMEEMFSQVNNFPFTGDAKKDADSLQNMSVNAIANLEIQAVLIGKVGGVDKYEMRPVGNPKLLPYLKPFAERPYIGPYELAAIAQKRHPECDDFPALDAGDLIYVVDSEKGNDHVSLLEQARGPGFDAGEAMTTLQNPFYCIDGGQVDPYNIGKGPEAKFDAAASEELGKVYDTLGNTASKEVLEKYPSGTVFKDSKGVIRTFLHVNPPKTVTNAKGEEIPKNYSAPAVADATVGKPTGILRVKRDLGAKRFAQGKVGFYLGAQKITLANNSVSQVGDVRQITYIARANLMLDERENRGMEAGVAAAAQDEITQFLWRRRIERNTGDIERVWLCFPTVGLDAYKRDGQKKKAEAEAKKNSSGGTP